VIRALGALVVAVALSLAAVPVASATPTVSFTMTGTAGTNGWFRSNVTIRWTITEPESLISSSGCEAAQLVTAEGQSSHTCTVTFPGGSNSATATPRIDKTAPSVAGGNPTRGPDSNGWYNHAVEVAFTGSDATSGIASCASPQYSGPDGASRQVSGTCTDGAGNVSAPTSVTLRYDSTPPSVTVAPTREADVGGWYNRAVSITASGSDPVSGVASCTTPSYSGPDNPAASVKATCVDNAGNTSAPVEATIKYDATEPTVAAKVDREPDANGWYRGPFKLTFTGSDATSGLVSCTAPIEYKGPDNATATLAGTCRDAAGNARDTAFEFKYDATGPKLGSLVATGGKGLVRVGWQRPADAASIELVRKPGLKGAASTVVYRGAGLTFADKSVRNGARYRYELRITDTAGNVTTQAVTATPRPPLFKPGFNAVVRGPVKFAWDASGAKFYNLQLLRDGVKLLSAWPKAATFVLGSTWRYAGKTQELVPGKYRWYVWGARGTRERPQYGRPLGTSTFVVKAR
jgi:hypothetical protein